MHLKKSAESVLRELLKNPIRSNARKIPVLQWHDVILAGIKFYTVNEPVPKDETSAKIQYIFS
jgi:hypothetical protein